jgi:hypothetical protein
VIFSQWCDTLEFSFIFGLDSRTVDTQPGASIRIRRLSPWLDGTYKPRAGEISIKRQQVTWYPVVQQIAWCTLPLVMIIVVSNTHERYIYRWYRDSLEFSRLEQWYVQKSCSHYHGGRLQCYTNGTASSKFSLQHTDTVYPSHVW